MGVLQRPPGEGHSSGLGGRTKEGLSGCLETLSLVFLQPVRGD